MVDSIRTTQPPAKPPAPDRHFTGRERLRQIIFEADTPAGKAFDVALLFAIVASVAAVIAESLPGLPEAHGQFLRVIEWGFTAIFSVEFALRLYCAPQPLRYVASFYGAVDLLSILPSYLSLLIPGSQSLLVIRSLRLLRVFRVLKLGHFVGEANILLTALYASTRKVLVFLATVVILVVILGAAMYFVEGGQNGFESILHAMYWAVVTMTTVGYGDVVPVSTGGKFLASLVMILGYSIIAIPTGIVTAEIIETARGTITITTRVCHACMSEGHEHGAAYCKDCGNAFPTSEVATEGGGKE